MLDIFDFIVEKGGDPKKIKESQRCRYAPEEAVDEVIALYEDHRKSESSFAILPERLYADRVCSPVLGDTSKDQNQRDPKTNRCQEEGEGECRRFDEAEGGA